MAKPEKAEKVKVKPCCSISAELIPGIFVLTLGVLLLLSDLNIIAFNGPMVLLILGAVFLLVYAATGVWAFLIPGVILAGIGLVIYFGLESQNYLFPLVVAISFLSVYITRLPATRWAIIPGVILAAISFMLGFEALSGINAWPFILIGIGLYLLFKNYKK